MMSVQTDSSDFGNKTIESVQPIFLTCEAQG